MSHTGAGGIQAVQQSPVSGVCAVERNAVSSEAQSPGAVGAVARHGASRHGLAAPGACAAGRNAVSSGAQVPGRRRLGPNAEPATGLAARATRSPGSPWQKAPLHSSGDASRLTALFVGYICPICALLTPGTGCRDASPLSVRRGVSPRAAGHASTCRSAPAAGWRRPAARGCSGPRATPGSADELAECSTWNRVDRHGNRDVRSATATAPALRHGSR